MPARVLFIDVDDTLVRCFGTKRTPMTAVVEKVRALHAAGALMYLWSSSGEKYARQVAMELGLAQCFAGFLPKPDVLLDDRPIAKWKLKELHPTKAIGLPPEQILR